MTADGRSEFVADLAGAILENGLHGGPSGLDGDTVTWSWSTADDLMAAIEDCKSSENFAQELVRSMENFPRGVSLLAVEVLTLPLLPITDVDQQQVDIFHRLIAAVEGRPIVIPDSLRRGVEGQGYRAARLEDNLSERLLWLTEYVRAYGVCPDYAGLLANGYDEYLGHEDLHDPCPFLFRMDSPWVSAELSAAVDGRDHGMRFDLDHMKWPDHLPPPAVRAAGERIRVDVAHLLSDLGGDSEIAIAKDLYLAKQLIGSWEELAEAHVR